MSKEGARQYFSQKTSLLLWLLGAVGLGMVYVGYAGERRSVIFMAVGVVLALLCIYEVIRGKRRKKRGTELDALVREALKGNKLYTDALKELCIDAADVMDCERIALGGYCAYPIATRPYFRRDEEDGKLRSSNYQSSLFIFCSDRFYTYSDVISLVDKEREQSGRMWRFGRVTDARVVCEPFTYLVGTDDEKRETCDIEYLHIADAEGGVSFFFERENGGAERVERILSLIMARMGEELPSEEAPSMSVPLRSADSAARGRDLSVGEIGDEIAPL